MSLKISLGESEHHESTVCTFNLPERNQHVGDEGSSNVGENDLQDIPRLDASTTEDESLDDGKKQTYPH